MTRINPYRPSTTTAAGLRRIVLTTSAHIEAHTQTKPLRTIKNPKTYFLVIIHSERGALSSHARQAIAAAAILADTKTKVLALILGELTEDLTNTGADEVLILPELDFEHFQPELALANVSALIESARPSRIFMPDNFIDGDLGRRLIAQQQSKSAVTHVVEIDNNHITAYHAGGSLLAQSALPDITLLDANAVDAHLPFTSSAKLIDAPVIRKTVSNIYQDLGTHTIAAAEMPLEEADFIVSAGNGVQKVATFELLAHALEASIGASRVVVDDGKFARDKQIGASGKTVSACAYLAIGISGAVQHLQGIKDCQHVVAINTDASAPIIKRANLSIIGDAEEIMQTLITLIAEAKSEKLKVMA
jgi:electron transfer flavoprotein alpha subunit